MEIKKFFKKSNMIEDCSGDYVQVKMTTDNWNFLVSSTKYKWESPALKARLEALLKVISEAESKAKGIWY